MLERLKLLPLQERQRIHRLTLLYKVVKGCVPAINIEHYLKPLRKKRNIRAKHHEDFIQQNIVENQINNNSQCYQPIYANTVNYRNSFFVRTVPDWNKLPDSVIKLETTDSFKSHLLKDFD